MLKVGDRVKKRDDPELKGEVVGVSTVSSLWGIDEYEIQWDSYTRSLYHYETDLVKITEDRGKCTCGASKTYAPKDPPGHAHHCDWNKVNEQEIQEPDDFFFF